MGTSFTSPARPVRRQDLPGEGLVGNRGQAGEDAEHEPREEEVPDENELLRADGGAGWAGKTAVAYRSARSGANQGRRGRTWEPGLPGSLEPYQGSGPTEERAVDGRRRQGPGRLGNLRFCKIGCAAHAGAVGRGARMAARKAGRNIHRRHVGSRRALGSNRGEIDLWAVDQPGPGRTGVGAGAWSAQDLWGEGETGTRAVLEDCGGRTRVGDSAGGRGLGRLGSFEHAA